MGSIVPMGALPAAWRRASRDQGAAQVRAVRRLQQPPPPHRTQVNLFLRVMRRREDGYHDLASLFHVRRANGARGPGGRGRPNASTACSLIHPQVIDLGDDMSLEVLPEGADSKDTLACSDASIPTDERNLVVKARARRVPWVPGSALCCCWARPPRPRASPAMAALPAVWLRWQRRAQQQGCARKQPPIATQRQPPPHPRAQALVLFRAKTGLPTRFRVTLDKRVPHGAGLGGGSGNAATALWAANELCGPPRHGCAAAGLEQ